MRGPLSLVIDDGNGSRHVTLRTTNLRFKRSAYGGDIDLTATIQVSRRTFTDLGPGDSLILYDARTGGIVWQGTTHQPGVTVGPLGESLEIQAFGGAVRLMATTESLAYVHELHEDFRRVDSTKGANVDQQEKNNGTPTLEVSWAKLFELENGDQGQMACRTFQHAGLKIARFKADVDAGRNDADLVLRLMTGTDVDTLTATGISGTTVATTATGFLYANVDGGAISVGDDIVGIRVAYVGPTLEVHKNATTDKVEGGVPDKTYWARFFNVTVCQLRKDKYGANIVTGYDESTVFAHEVINDMLGRGMCPGLDMDKVTVTGFDYAIDALSWLDGIKMGDALAELRKFEPSLLWTVYGDSAAFASWADRGVRYVVSSRDGGVTHPGEEVSLANRIYISWRDRRGRQRTTVVTADVPELGGDPADPGFDGMVIDADPIDLGDESGSEANAQRVGEKALELTNNPPKAGTAVVRRPIMDLVTGAMVLPHEIVPGWLVMEQETGDEFRLTEVDYSDDDAAAVLTLGEPVRRLDAVIARLERGQRRRGRK